MGNLDHGTITLDLEQLQRVKLPVNTEGTRTKLQTGDVLISITAELGMVGVVPAQLGEAYINQHVALARPNKATIPQFLGWYLASTGKRELELMRRGATKVGLGLDDIRNVEILLPPLNEQRRIVTKIEALTDKSRRAKEALDAIPPLLEKFRQSILAAAFRGDLTADWRKKNPNTEPASQLLACIRTERRQRWETTELAKLKAKGKPPKDDKWKAKYKEPAPVDTEGLPELPEGWVWASVEVLLSESLCNGFSPKSGNDANGTLTLKLSATTRGVCCLSEATTKRIYETCPLESSYWLKPNDLLVQRANSLEYVGTAAVFEGPEKTYIYPDLMMRLRVVAGVSTHFLWRAFGWHRSKAYLRANATGTAGNMPKINGPTVRRMAVPLPPAEEQEVILQVLKSGEQGLQGTESCASLARRQVGDLKASILAKAFRGELVPQDPNDEPASVLLDRIRAEREAAAPAPKKKRPTKKKATS